MTWEGPEHARRLLKSRSYAALNERRGVLIDRDIDGLITPEERRELEYLQACVTGLVDAAHPMPDLRGAAEAIRRALGITSP